MRKLLLLLPIFLGCLVEVTPEPFPDCIYDIDCLPGDICLDGFCTYDFIPLLPGESTVDCQCWGDYYIFIGETRITNLCESGMDIVEMCVGCCEYWRGQCVEPMLGRFCT